MDNRADIYALGIVAYEMLTGRVPFAADTPVAVLMKHVQDPIPVPSPRDVPEPLMRALLKALAKRPDERWPTAVAFVQALADGLGQVSTASAMPATPTGFLPTEPATPAPTTRGNAGARHRADRGPWHATGVPTVGVPAGTPYPGTPYPGTPYPGTPYPGTPGGGTPYPQAVGAPYPGTPPGGTRLSAAAALPAGRLSRRCPPYAGGPPPYPDRRLSRAYPTAPHNPRPRRADAASCSASWRRSSWSASSARRR